MPPGSFPPGSMPPGMRPPGTFPPGSMSQGMRPPNSFPQPEGLHHGFGPGEHFMGNEGSRNAKAMISVPQLGQEQVSRWENTSAIVGEYRSIYPSPETEQYLVFDQNVLARQEKIEQRWCSTTDGYGARGRANLRNFVDAAIMNWKERIMSPWNWYYIHADGWHINFWEDNFWLCKQSDTDCP